MIHGYREIQTLRIEPGPYGPERHVHIDRRDLSAEEAKRLRSLAIEAFLDPDRLREKLAEAVRGGSSSLLLSMFPEAKAFIEQIQARMGRGS